MHPGNEARVQSDASTETPAQFRSNTSSIPTVEAAQFRSNNSVSVSVSVSLADGKPHFQSSLVQSVPTTLLESAIDEQTKLNSADDDVQAFAAA